MQDISTGNMVLKINSNFPDGDVVRMFLLGVEFFLIMLIIHIHSVAYSFKNKLENLYYLNVAFKATSRVGSFFQGGFFF